jgi:hypothetical protein
MGRNKITGQNRAINDAAQSVKQSFYHDFQQAWLERGQANCINGNASLTFPSFADTGFDAGPLDSAALALLIPAKLPDGVTPNPYYTAVKNLISAYGITAPAKCSDPAVLADGRYSAIGADPLNQAFCRCATASTYYGTLAPRASDTELKSRTVLYGCAMVMATSGSSLSGLSQDSKILVEGAFSVVNLSNNTVRTCSQLTSGSNMPANTFGRLNYVFYFQEKDATGKASTAKIAGSFLSE